MERREDREDEIIVDALIRLRVELFASCLAGGRSPARMRSKDALLTFLDFSSLCCLLALLDTLLDGWQQVSDELLQVCAKIIR